VIGGSGGAGATTFACALALTGARQGPSLLMDLDPLGPGADRVVGLDEPGGVRWDELGSSTGRLGARSLRAALPTRDGVAVLTWPVTSGTALEAGSVREVLSAGQRGSDLVVVDLPRSGGALVEAAVARCHHVVVVVEATVAGVAAAAHVVAWLGAQARLGLMVRTGRSASVLADQVTAALQLPVLAEVPTQRRLVEHVELGLGPVRSRRGPMARAARTVLAQTSVAAR
jgi:secretion/DNA translocation related CpaE-like protein